MRNAIVLTVLAGMLAGAINLTFGQDQPSRVPSAPDQPPRRVDPGQRRERPDREAVRGGEGLTEEQRQKVREATEKVREEQRAASDKLRQARQELDEVVRAVEIDEAKIRAKAQVIGQLEGDLAVLRARQYGELRKILPKEQFERVQQPGNAGGRFGAGRPEGPRQAPQPTTRQPAAPTQPK